MSSKNNDNSGIAIVIGIMAAAAILMFAVLAFIAFGLTILAIFAWNRPLTLGKWTLEPEEARGFVYRGLIGMWLLPAFVLFCDLVFSVGVVWDYLPHMMGIGYVGGSIGVDILFAQSGQTQLPVEVLPPSPQIEAKAAKVVRAEERPVEPFRFATWDDEESER